LYPNCNRTTISAKGSQGRGGRRQETYSNSSVKTKIEIRKMIPNIQTAFCITEAKKD
jgi:hypothetical protein